MHEFQTMTATKLEDFDYFKKIGNRETNLIFVYYKSIWFRNEKRKENEPIRVQTKFSIIFLRRIFRVDRIFVSTLVIETD